MISYQPHGILICTSQTSHARKYSEEDMKKTFRTGSRAILALTILLINLGLDTQTVYAVAPSHDDFANAKLVDSITYSDLNVNITDATTQTINPPNGADPDNVGPCEINSSTGLPKYLNRGLQTVWYKYTNTTGADQPFAVDTSGSSYDTYLAVWTGTENSLSLVGCNDDNFFGYSEMIFIAQPGVTYYIQVAKFNGYYGEEENLLGAGTLQFHTFSPKNTEVHIGTSLMGTYYVQSGQEKREFYPASGGPVRIESITNDSLVSAIRLQSMQEGTLLDYNETMGIPEGSLSTKYYFPVYENLWAPLNSQLRFAHLGAGTKTIKVTIGTETWTYDVAQGQDKRIFLNRSGGPVIVESGDGTTPIIAAIRLQCMKDGILNCYSETMGIPVEDLSTKYYFPVYENLWAPLNSQLRFAHLGAGTKTIKVTIGTETWTYDVAEGQDKRIFLSRSGGPVIVESLDGVTKVIAAIRLQSMQSGTLLDYNETMGIPEGSLSTKYIFPVYENLWAPLNSQLRFAHLGAGTKTIKVTIGTETWTYDVAEGQDKRIFLNRSGGPVIIESLDGVTQIVAAIRLQCMKEGLLNCYSETMGIPFESLSDTYYFPVYENKWAPLNSQVRFGMP
jgi:hypothetical protein